MARHNQPEGVAAALCDALLGLRVTRPSYLKMTEIDDRTATRDLVGAADAGLLTPKGERRGRYYVAGAVLVDIRRTIRGGRVPLTDPYPTLAEEISRPRRTKGDRPR